MIVKLNEVSLHDYKSRDGARNAAQIKLDDIGHSKDIEIVPIYDGQQRFMRFGIICAVSMYEPLESYEAKQLSDKLAYACELVDNLNKEWEGRS